MGSVDNAECEIDSPELMRAWMLSAKQAQALLGSGSTGLDERTAEARLSRIGPNRLPEPKRASALLLFLRQFTSFLILLLIGAAVLAFFVGNTKDALVIFGVVLFNAILGFVQEYRAEAAVAALRKMLTPTARVCRSGKIRTVLAENLVPGDWVFLGAGDRIPADGRLMAAHGLEVDESSLTGESVPVTKGLQAIDNPDLPLGDRVNLAFMNTVVTRGRGELLVLQTGPATEMGRLASLLGETEATASPLQKQIDILGKRLAVIAGIVVAVIGGMELLRGVPLAELVVKVVAIAVAAIPEGLPAVVTVTLAIGMARMARGRAIVKRMAAVEALGCTTDICSDKTGTLTLNQMTARAVALDSEILNVTGHGYQLDGKIEGAHGSPNLQELLRASALCNDATVRDGAVIGDPTEGAFYVLAEKGGIDVDALRASEPRVGEIPFESERKFSATLHPTGTLYVKGAPEVLLERCTEVLGKDGTEPLDEHARAEFRQANIAMAADGLRVLAVAKRTLEPKDSSTDTDALLPWVEELQLIGMIGMLDPPREEAREAIALCQKAGISVRMITGDHATTGLAIARTLGIEGDAISGRELDALSDEALQARLPELGVFARVSPEHKLRIIAALQAQTRVVAMLGDGVNDAPALKRADIGVAMGITGTQVTQEAASLVLADDNFATVVSAVREGRTIYDNIVRFLRFQLSTNMGALLAIFFAPLLGLPGPFTPLQLLWVNLIMDGPPAMALGLDPPHRDVMRRPPRDPQERILTGRRLSVLLFFGLVMAAGTLGLLWIAAQQRSPAEAVTLAFTTFVLFQLFNVMNARFERSSALSRQLFTNLRLWLALTVVLAFQILAVHFAPLQSILDTSDLSLSDWALATAIAASVLVLEELRKLMLRPRSRRRFSLTPLGRGHRETRDASV